MSSKGHNRAAPGAAKHGTRVPSIGKVQPLIRTVLVPTDFSDCSLAGLTYAVRFAKEVGARIIVLHVTDLGPVMMTTEYGDYS